MQITDLDFFIIGAARAGTSTMWDLLVRTPGVFLPQKFLHKEPGYFSELTGMSSRNRYLSLFDSVPSHNRVLGEASTAYLTDPSAAERIAKEVPGARIIVMLRNPADRAYSLYNWMVQEGYEWAPTFERALQLEYRRAESEEFRENNPQYFYNYLYFRSGKYAEQLERFRKHFPAERLHVVIFEEFIERPEAGFRNVLGFLDVSVSEPLPKVRRINPSRRPRAARLQYVLRRITNWLTLLRPGQPPSKASRDFLLRLGIRDESPKPLKPGLRRRLLEAYKDDICRVGDLLDRDLSAWMFPE